MRATRIHLLAACVAVAGFLPSCASRKPVATGDVTVVQPGEGKAPVATEQPSLSDIEKHRFTLGESDGVVGTVAALRLRQGDTLLDVARHFGLGFEEITSANPDVDPWVPPTDVRAVVPVAFVLPRATRRGIVINLAAMRLFHFPSRGGGREVVTYPVGIGREGKSSPTGAMSIVKKTKHPAWYPTANIRADHLKKGDPLPAMVPAGPDNPLGDYAMYLSRPMYLIHGTNKPFSIGLRASNGCIRLYPENISSLFPEVSVNEPVTIVNQPYLIGTRDGVVFLQAYHPQEELDDRALRARIREDLKALESSKSLSFDWQRIDRLLEEGSGIATAITPQTRDIAAERAVVPLLAHPGRLEGQPVVPPDGEGWRVFASESVSETTAKRLAAFLNHQGPQIPARVVANGERYQVIAGPYENPGKAKAAVQRMRVDLDLESHLLAPDTAVAASPSPAGAPESPIAVEAPLQVEVPRAEFPAPEPRSYELREPAFGASEPSVPQPSYPNEPAVAEPEPYPYAEPAVPEQVTVPAYENPAVPTTAAPEPAGSPAGSESATTGELPAYADPPLDASSTSATEPRPEDATGSPETAPGWESDSRGMELPLEVPPEFVPAINSARARHPASGAE